MAVPPIVGGVVFTGAVGDGGDGTTGPTGGDGATGVVGELPGGDAGGDGFGFGFAGGDGFRLAALTQRQTLV
ncbi:MAG TPA: hypothetical protein VIJ71_04680 [Mycobacteriales bacterium]